MPMLPPPVLPPVEASAGEQRRSADAEQSSCTSAPSAQTVHSWHTASASTVQADAWYVLPLQTVQGWHVVSVVLVHSTL